MALTIEKGIILSQYTTIGLGGKAKYFAVCSSVDEIRDALEFARAKSLRVQVISGGSNVVFPDEGFDGLVIKIGLKGTSFDKGKKFLEATVSAGESWDDFVKLIIEKGATGIECLSGIPGSAGATPVQNVGAYGQEVSDTILSLKAIDRKTFSTVVFDKNECRFGYRKSRFKSEDTDKFVITEVTFRFQMDAAPIVKYPELKRYLESDPGFHWKNSGLGDKLNKIRECVLTLRKRKSMIIDKNDPNSRSCGSFFLNPVLSESEFKEFEKRLGSSYETFPYYESECMYKIPAAWLVEQSGFSKGYVKGGAGISGNHSLAIINRNGTSKDVMELAFEIEKVVGERFGIKLKPEPVII